ncbi:MAG: hypothetical protein GY898_23095 [Proteobacteria bacterium]|nr:hypothetical protein [Pseudomonadota bacterium]
MSEAPPRPEDQQDLLEAEIIEEDEGPEVLEAEAVDDELRNVPRSGLEIEMPDVAPPRDDDTVDLETGPVVAAVDAAEVAKLAAENPGAALMRIVDNAVAGGLSIEVIERLLAVHERYEAGQARKLYNAAMAALRGELPKVFKTEEVDYKAKGGRVYYRHENLANMVEDLSPIMARHGLAFRWKTDTTIPESIQVVCVVTHEAGHSEEAALSGPPDTSGSKNAIQAIASTVSYLQRYTLKAAIGLAAGKDDDGRGGEPAEPIEQPRSNGNGQQQDPGPGEATELEELHQARPLFPADRSETISKNQRGRLYNFAGKKGWKPEGVDNEVARVLQIRTSEIPALGDAYEAIVTWFAGHSPTAD